MTIFNLTTLCHLKLKYQLVSTCDWLLGILYNFYLVALGIFLLVSK